MMVFAELIYRLFINWATHFILTQVSQPFLFVHLLLPRPLTVACEGYYSPLFPTTLRKQYSPQQRYCFNLIALFNPAEVLCTILKQRPSGRGRERKKCNIYNMAEGIGGFDLQQYLVKNPWLGSLVIFHDIKSCSRMLCGNALQADKTSVCWRL